MLEIKVCTRCVMDTTDPGIVFLYGEIPDYLETFSQRTIQGLVKKIDAIV